MTKKRVTAGVVPKIAQITFRCSELVKEAIMEQASKDGLTLSAFVDQAVREHLRRKGVRVTIEQDII
jgi:predicted DNA binding CopG/RHH family protein